MTFRIIDALTKHPVPGLRFTCRHQARQLRRRLNIRGFRYYVKPCIR